MKEMDQERNALQEWKRQARKTAAETRNALSEELRLQRSEAACRHAAELLIRQRAGCFAVYKAFRSELETSFLIEWGWQQGLKVLLPRTWSEQGRMELYEVSSWQMLSKGRYGLLEPDPHQAKEFDITKEKINVVFVPGLAFDRRGGRLGYGGGYYDRFRQRMDEAEALRAVKRAPWVGLFFDNQEMDEIKMASHDCSLDGVVTESGIRVISSYLKENG